MPAVITASAISARLPIAISGGWKTKTNGTMYATMPSRIPAQPVFQKTDFAMAAAAYVARQSGGVMSESMPKRSEERRVGKEGRDRGAQWPHRNTSSENER